MSDITISKHAKERLKSRNGWGKKTIERMVQRVYEEGIRMDDLKGYLKQWAKKFDDDGAEYVIFGDSLFIFRNRVLVTAYHVPSRVRVLGA